MGENPNHPIKLPGQAIVARIEFSGLF